MADLDLEKILEDVAKRLDFLDEKVEEGFKPNLSDAIRPESGPSNMLADAIVSGVTKSALRENVDPELVVKQRLAQQNPARTMLADFLMGWGDSMTGQPMRTTRQQLLQREILKQELNNKRDANLADLYRTMTGYQTDLVATSQSARSADMRGAEVGISQVGGQADELLRHEDTITEQNNASGLRKEEAAERKRLAVEEARLKAQIVPVALEEQLEHLNGLLMNPDLSPEDRAKYQARVDTGMKMIESRYAEDARMKQDAALRFPMPSKPKTQGFLLDRQSTYGTQKVRTVVAEDGTVLHETPIGPLQYDKPSRDEVRGATRVKETTNRISRLALQVEDKRIAFLQNKLAKFLEGGETTMEGFQNFFRSEKVDVPDAVEAELFQSMGRLVLERVLELSGKASTEKEADRIKASMPGLLTNASTFNEAISLLRIQSEWSAYRINNNLLESDAASSAGINSPYDASRAISALFEGVKSGKYSAEFLLDYSAADLHQLEKSLRADEELAKRDRRATP